MDIRNKIKEILVKHFGITDPKIIDRAVFDFELLIGKSLDKKRTLIQNRALHLYCQQLADAFNAAGLDMKKVIKPDVEIEWTMEGVKEYIWRPIQKFLYNKESTTQLEKHELDKIHENINRHLAANPNTQGLPYIPFPHKPKTEEKEIDYPEGQEEITAF